MKKAILIFTLFILQNVLFAQTSIWKIQKNDEIIYLGGTIHLLRAKDYPLPIEYEKA
ncbi:MAG: TraB/GumN family protein, partial [Campylobacteraceae bacterium]|nr:TraB/GumN family protein [Campylobacteraceae bacterium]